MPRFVLPALLTVCASLAMAGCGDSAAVPTSPTPNVLPTVTEKFAGELNRNGARTHPFLAGASGNVTATLDTLTPETITAIGLSLGTWNGFACQIIIANDTAPKGTVVLGAASSAGSLCVRVYDVGNVSNLASYELTVVHP